MKQKASIPLALRLICKYKLLNKILFRQLHLKNDINKGFYLF